MVTSNTTEKASKVLVQDQESCQTFHKFSAIKMADLWILLIEDIIPN